MGRGSRKGKKPSLANNDEPGSPEEEKIPARKRRGRPQKSLKDEVDDDTEIVEDEDSENAKTTISNKTAENGKKRKRDSQPKEELDSVKEESGNGTRSSTDESSKSNGFRHKGNRRKSKPHRAAEAGVECK